MTTREKIILLTRRERIILSITRGDIEEALEGYFECLGLDREPTQEEIDHACHWVAKDFDYTHVFDSIDSILWFRMGPTLKQEIPA